MQRIIRTALSRFRILRTQAPVHHLRFTFVQLVDQKYRPVVESSAELCQLLENILAKQIKEHFRLNVVVTQTKNANGQHVLCVQ